MSETPHLYSYIRFSTPEQALSDSERRQLKSADDYAASHSLPVDLTLRMADRGLSGYKGHHRKKGALGAFLKKVKDGVVAPGSVLAVENVDRLSREGVFKTIKHVVMGLVDKNVAILVLTSGIVIDRDALNDWRWQYFCSELNRAYEESKRKSELVRESWIEKRRKVYAEVERRADAYKDDAGYSILSGRHPAWLVLVKEQVGRKIVPVRFEVIPEAAEAVRLIFEWRLKGLGVEAIAKKLNEVAPWTPPHNPKRKGHGWKTTYVRKILVNRAVVGEFLPHVLFEAPADPDEPDGDKVLARKPVGDAIPDYYPAIVDPNDFRAVQKMREERPDKGGRPSRTARNLLVHLVKCGYCGGSMVLVFKGSDPKHGGEYLVCDHGRHGVSVGKVACGLRSIHYDEVERLVLDNCPDLQPEQVLPDPDEQAEACRAIRKRIKAKEAELHDVGQRIANLEDQIERTNDAERRDRYETRLTELDAWRKSAEAEKAADERELARREQGREAFAAWQRSLATLIRKLKSGNKEIRLNMRAHLAELIEKVEVFSEGHAERGDPKESNQLDRPDAEYLDLDLWDFVEENAPEALGDKIYRADLEAYSEELVARRMSKEGRFVRVHFRGGGVVTLAPDGGLAESVRLEKNGISTGDLWERIKPDDGPLWQEFLAGKARGKARRRKGG